MPAEAGPFLSLLLAVQAGTAADISVSTVTSGRCFIAAAQEVCLAGIAEPSLPAATGFSLRARSALEHEVLDAPLAIDPVGEPDRWGRQAVLARARGAQEPVQLALLRAGTVQLQPDTVPAGWLEDFRAAQLTAQVTRRGLWAREETRVLYTGEAGNALGEARFIRGRILYTGESKGRVWLNFGPDYRTDFTVFLAPAVAAALAEEELTPAALTGRRVEIYGLIRNENGPAVELTSGAAIRVIPD